VAVDDGGAGDGVVEGGGVVGVCVAVAGTGVADGVEVKPAATRVMPGTGEARPGIVTGPQAAANIRINQQTALAVFVICSKESATRALWLTDGLGQQKP
jgi:hypothetical protein